jgi:hypothetical protein
MGFMARAGLIPSILALVLAGCAGPASPSISVPASSASVSASPVTKPASASTAPEASPTSTASADTQPSMGRPYDAAAILAAMQESRRPGGVPQDIQTASIAEQLAASIWTYDGEPWPMLTASGSCGPSDCTLDLSGTPAGATGEDLYTFSVTPGEEMVELLVADLHGYPKQLDSMLDGIVRDGLAEDRLSGLALVAGRWLPPPRDGQFILGYRSGGEEGSPALDVTVDLPTGRVLDAETPAS